MFTFAGNKKRRIIETSEKRDGGLRGAVGGKRQQLCLGVQQIHKDLSVDGVVIAAGAPISAAEQQSPLSPRPSADSTQLRVPGQGRETDQTGLNAADLSMALPPPPSWELQSNFVSLSLNLTSSLSLRPHCIASSISFTTKALSKAVGPAQCALRGLRGADKCPKESYGC